MEGTGRGWPTAGTSGSHWKDRGGGKETAQNEGEKCEKPKITGVKANVWDWGRAGHRERERERSTKVPLNKRGKPLKERDKYDRAELAK